MPEEPNPFYATLSAYYDVLFPVEAAILSFLENAFQKSRRILDVACGTGIYTIPLWEKGKEIVGVDLDSAMIQQARQKLANRIASRPSAPTLASPTMGPPETRPSDTNPPELFLTEDMRVLSSFPDQSFDGIYCIGNSLPHLSTEEDIRTALKRFWELFKPGGTLLIQIVNFDRVTFRERPYHDLPPLEGRGAKLARRYTPGPDADHVYFETELSAEGKTLRNRLPLYRLTNERLTQALADAGFGSLSARGSYEGAAYDPSSSFLLIVTASRPD